MAAAATVKILRTMGELHMLGNPEQAKQTICLFSGYGHPNSSSFAAGLRTLRAQNLISPGNKGHLRLTEHGVRALPTNLVPPANTAEVHDRLLNILGNKMANRDKLEQLWDILKDGKAHSASDLSAALGYSHPNSSPFAALIRRIKELGVASRSNGQVQLTDIAFPMGRP